MSLMTNTKDSAVSVGRIACMMRSCSFRYLLLIPLLHQTISSVHPCKLRLVSHCLEPGVETRNHSLTNAENSALQNLSAEMNSSRYWQAKSSQSLPVNQGNKGKGDQNESLEAVFSSIECICLSLSDDILRNQFMITVLVLITALLRVNTYSILIGSCKFTTKNPEV